MSHRPCPVPPRHSARLLVPQCASRLHVLIAVFTGALSVALKANGMSQWNVAVATVAGATLGLVLSLRKKRTEEAV